MLVDTLEEVNAHLRVQARCQTVFPEDLVQFIQNKFN